MMFQLFEAIAGRVRDQAADYASAQARIVARTMTQAANPLGFALGGFAETPLPVPIAQSNVRASQPRSEPGVQRTPRAKAGRSPRRRSALNMA